MKLSNHEPYHIQVLKSNTMTQIVLNDCRLSYPRNLKGRIVSLFDPCVNAMGRRPYWPSHMEASNCTFGLAPSFGMICAHYRYCVIHRGITYMRVCLKSTWENATLYAERNCLAGLATKKSSPGTITHLHTWRQDGRHNRFPLNISLVLPLRNAA